MTLRVISYGGGVQSTALVVLAARGDLGEVDAALFANVGDDSEHPATLRYVREIAQPWAQERGLPIHELKRTRRDGSFVSLFQRLTNPDSRSLPIPVRMDNGAPGTRSCTASYKIEVLGKWVQAHGGSLDDPAEVMVGISLDEMERANSRKHSNPYERITYPLLDRRLTRDACLRIITDAGLPVPHKSACWFCPFHRMSTWREMKRAEPELFHAAVALEALLNERRDTLGKDHVYLTRFAMPLDRAVGDGTQLAFDFGGPESCDEGYCFV